MSTLSIVGATLPYYQRGGTVARLKVWFDQTFETPEGITIIGGAPRSNGFFVDVACTVDASADEVTYPTFSLPTTNDSSVRNARATAMLFDSGGNFVCYVFVNFIIPEQLAPTTTLAALSAYNAAGNKPPGPTYPTTDQIMTLIREGLQAEPITGTLTEGAVPRASGPKELVDGKITDDGTDVGIQTLNYVQMGDYQNLQNGSYIDVNDTFGRADVFAGSDATDQYAGLAALCGAGSAGVFVQSTGQTHLYGASLVTTLGDAQSDGNQTQIVIDDPNRVVIQTVANAVPDDNLIANERVCFYLDESGGKLTARIRLSDGSYATWEGAYTPD